MSVQRQFQGVIFDFNGTLFWDTDKHTAAWKLLSEQLRGTPFTDRELRENVHGRTNPIILEYLLNGPVDPETFEKLSLQKEEFYRALCLKNPGCLKLAARKSYWRSCRHMVSPLPSPPPPSGPIWISIWSISLWPGGSPKKESSMTTAPSAESPIRISTLSPPSV